MILKHWFSLDALKVATELTPVVRWNLIASQRVCKCWRSWLWIEFAWRYCILRRSGGWLRARWKVAYWRVPSKLFNDKGCLIYLECFLLCYWLSADTSLTFPRHLHQNFSIQAERLWTNQLSTELNSHLISA